MHPSRSIRGRLIAAYVLLAVIIGGVFAGSAFFVVAEIENELIDERLYRAAELWAASPYRSVQPPTSDLSFFIGKQVPQPLKQLGLGTHELRLNGRGLHVLIGERHGERYAIVDDQSDFESIESSSYVALGIAFLGGIVLAVLIGRVSASRVILPLTSLASAVQDEPQAASLPGLDATDEIGVLARAIGDRTQQLSLALQRERWFTADVSHELRTPLTIMLGAAEVLSRRLQDRPDLLAMTERISRNASDTAQQVAALLQLARAPEDAEFTRVALRPLIQHEIERCQPLLRGKPLIIQLTADEDVAVQAVPELVTIALSNLLRNACQHTEQGVISVQLDATQIVVEDTGSGLPEAVRARLFDRFVLGGESSSGPGLGLSIVKRVTEQLGWTVRHEPGSKGGSRFVLHLSRL
ncbi:Signal transduction histidine kinase [Pseudomonas benzenivorans]|nr:HAMP domain-containing sensor histidine kinase [Pseudomonas benzenivorans]SDG71980.1 Signal transduction histidine kinase [Pseudomonas benzenivorans]